MTLCIEELLSLYTSAPSLWHDSEVLCPAACAIVWSANAESMWPGMAERNVLVSDREVWLWPWCNKVLILILSAGPLECTVLCDDNVFF